MPATPLQPTTFMACGSSSRTYAPCCSPVALGSRQVGQLVGCTHAQASVARTPTGGAGAPKNWIAWVQARLPVLAAMQLIAPTNGPRAYMSPMCGFPGLPYGQASAGRWSWRGVGRGSSGSGSRQHLPGVGRLSFTSASAPHQWPCTCLPVPAECVCLFGPHSLLALWHEAGRQLREARPYLLDVFMWAELLVAQLRKQMQHWAVGT